MGSNLFNPAAEENLKEKLREAGAFGDERRDFYFWNTSPYNWDDMSCQMRPVKWNKICPKHWVDAVSDRFSVNIFSKPWTMPNDRLHHQYGALGNFTINALPEGYVEPKGNGKYDICVQKMYYFVNDAFNFEGSEPLGKWRLHKDNPAYPGEISGRYLFNGDFTSFSRHGYGREFPVLSRLHEIENFVPRRIPYEHKK